MVNVTIESEFVTGQYCFEKQIRQFAILDEGQLVDSQDFKGKPTKKVELLVECNNMEKSHKKWQPNQTSKKVLVKLFGSESKAWLGKRVKINLTPFEDKYSIVVDELDTIALNKPIGL